MANKIYRTLKARAEIPSREWIEFEVQLDESERVQNVKWHAWGCQKLLDTAAKLAGFMESQNLAQISWNEGMAHWDLLAQEVVGKLQSTFKIPISEEELCHCRKVPTQKVDEAVVLGAHTPEKVRAWTTATSGCGTCRPEVEKIINYRLKKV